VRSFGEIFIKKRNKVTDLEVGALIEFYWILFFSKSTFIADFHFLYSIKQLFVEGKKY